MRHSRKRVLAFDIGGTRVRTAIFDGTRLSGTTSHSWPGSGDAESEAGFVARCGLDAIAKAGGRPRITAMGISFAALMDGKGKVLDWPNRPHWNGFDFGRFLVRNMGIPFVIEDDANCASIGEFEFGCLKKNRGKSAMVLMAGTGFGAGLILDGALFKGGNGWAGEIGHYRMRGNGSKCGCGKRGCLQTLASGKALEEYCIRNGLGGIAELKKQAYAGNPKAARKIEESGKLTGLAASNCVGLFDLDAIVVGGGMLKLGPIWFNGFKTELFRGLSSVIRREFTLMKAEFPNENALLGAGNRAFRAV